MLLKLSILTKEFVSSAVMFSPMSITPDEHMNIVQPEGIVKKDNGHWHKHMELELKPLELELELSWYYGVDPNPAKGSISGPGVEIAAELSDLLLSIKMKQNQKCYNFLWLYCYCNHDSVPLSISKVAWDNI